MKLGVSSYSLVRAIRSNEMSVLDVMQWITDVGGEHMEIVPLGFDLMEKPELIDQIRNKAEETGLEISNYAIPANFIAETDDDYKKEIERVIQHVDIANRLGVKLMRHDVAKRPPEESTIIQFEADLSRLVDACRQVADYAAQYGITTSLENHGRYVQHSDRVQRLVHAVDRPNFRSLLDVGNFMVVDENPVPAVKKSLKDICMVHLKDFYLRPSYRDPGEGWIRTISGDYLRGAIVGQGDIDMYEVIKVIKQSGYDGYISIEFEGREDCKEGTRIGLDNARRIWDMA